MSFDINVKEASNIHWAESQENEQAVLKGTFEHNGKKYRVTAEHPAAAGKEIGSQIKRIVEEIGAASLIQLTGEEIRATFDPEHKMVQTQVKDGDTFKSISSITRAEPVITVLTNAANIIHHHLQPANEPADEAPAAPQDQPRNPSLLETAKQVWPYALGLAGAAGLAAGGYQLYKMMVSKDKSRPAAPAPSSQPAAPAPSSPPATRSSTPAARTRPEHKTPQQRKKERSRERAAMMRLRTPEKTHFGNLPPTPRPPKGDTLPDHISAADIEAIFEALYGNDKPAPVQKSTKSFTLPRGDAVPDDLSPWEIAQLFGNDVVQTPLLGEEKSLSEAGQEYKDRADVRDLMNAFNSAYRFQSIRGDGHCMFRSIGGALLYDLKEKPANREHFIQRLCAYNIDDADRMIEIINSLDSKSVSEVMNNEKDSDFIVQYLRNLACAHNKEKAKSDDLLRQNLADNMGRHPDSVALEDLDIYFAEIRNMKLRKHGGDLEMAALTEALGLSIVILDGVPRRGKATVNSLMSHHKDDTRPIKVHIMKRSEHYDLLMPRH